MKTAEEKILEITEKINRQIIENISCNEVLNDCSWGAQVGVLITTNDAEKLLEYASLKEDKWISVEERLPKESDADENGKVLILREVNSSQSFLSKSIHPYDQVKYCEKSTLWCSLPALPSPPKTENK